MGFFQNAGRPQGLSGRFMVNMMNSGHAPMAEWGFGHIEVQKGCHALDIGCGGGANVRRLLQKSVYGRVEGIDYSEISVEKSRKLNADAIRAGHCEILQGNVMKLPFPDSDFHLATAFETIYFWPDLVGAFRQIYRVLKDNGIFMICNECNGENPKDEKWTHMIEDMKLYSYGQMESYLRQAGFSNIKTDKNKTGWICVVAEKR